MNKESNFDTKKTTGLEGFGGLRKLEDLRIPFIITANIYFTGFGRSGPLIKGSRDSATAVNYFTALIFPHRPHRDALGRCLWHGSSRGVKEFLRTNYVTQDVVKWVY